MRGDVLKDFWVVCLGMELDINGKFEFVNFCYNKNLHGIF